MKWPHGKHNGRRIIGFAVKIKVDVMWWELGVSFGIEKYILHVGPIHVWYEAVYEWNRS